MTEANKAKEEKKIRNRFPDRFTIDPPNLEKIGRLLEQLRTSIQGCDANRKEILNWIVEKFPEELSPADLRELAERFYDEERFLRLALEEVRAAKARGERRTVEDILQRNSHSPTATRRGPRKKKVDVLGDGVNAPITETVAFTEQS
jgi:hypothetical protein